MKSNKARKVDMVIDWMIIMANENKGQYESANTRFVANYSQTIEESLWTMSEKQLQAVVSLIACANGLGHAQYRAQARSNGWVTRQTPCAVLTLVKRESA